MMADRPGGIWSRRSAAGGACDYSLTEAGSGLKSGCVFAARLLPGCKSPQAASTSTTPGIARMAPAT
jgi:hypothetical protein